ncbi:MAG: branched-chain amino acid ABC transporter permease [Candidatus Dormibacteraeota bacterium]|nr:branched-chain amino acid ABC transporter permease [Candidatus Dormibacteraeota bacterium]
MLTQLVIGLVQGGTYALLALGIVLVYKGSRVLNFAQGEIGTMALYVAYFVIVFMHGPWWLGALLAIAVAATVGVVFERVVVRRMGEAPRLSVAIGTVGLLTLLLTLEAVLWKPIPRVLPAAIPGLGVKVAGFYVSPSQMLALAVTLALGLGLAAFLRRTDFGLGILAAAEDATAARLMGIRLGRVSAFTWGAAAAIAAIAALLIEPTVGVFAPGYVSELFVRGLAAALVGGLTSLPGAFVGGLAVGVIEAMAVYFLRYSEVAQHIGTASLPGIDSLTVFLIIIVVLLVRPDGLLGKPQSRVA